MNCERIQQLYTDLFEGTLSPSVKQETEYHLSVCGECRTDYARFSEAMRLLDLPMDEVEVPNAFRAQILAKIAEQPKPSRFPLLDRLREAWLAPKTAQFKIAGAVLAAAAVMVVALTDHVQVGQEGANLGPSINQTSVAPTYSGVFDSLTATPDGDKIFHNFKIQLPKADPSAFVSAYVLQNDRAMTDDAALNDPASATLAWHENDPLQNTVQVNIPVAVVSSVPAGSTLSFMVEATPADSASSPRKDVAVVPLDDSEQPVAIPEGSSLYTTLQAVAASQDINIIVDNSAIKSLQTDPYSAPAGFDGTTKLATLLASKPQLNVVQQGPKTFAVVYN